MPRKYRCPVYMEHTASLARKLDDPDFAAELVECGRLSIDLEIALRQDQHNLFHDAEFVDGCDICDDERVRYR